MRVVRALIFLLFGVSLSSPGYAEPEKIVVLKIQGPGLFAVEKSLFRSAIVETLKKKYQVLDVRKVDKKLAPIFAAEGRKEYCDTLKCFQEISNALKVDLVATCLVLERPLGYMLTFQIKRVLENRDIMARSEFCEGCGPNRIIPALKAMAVGKPLPPVVAAKDLIPSKIAGRKEEERARFARAITKKEKRVDAEWILQTNVNYGTWSSDTTPKKDESQSVLYYSLSHLAPKYGFILLGSWVDTKYKYEDPAKEDFSLSNMTDTTLSSFYKTEPHWGFIGRGGIDFNLPTGYPSMSNDELSSLFIDNVIQDLVVVSTFGKGFDIAPNLALTRPIGKKAVLGLGIRYEFTGEYDPTSDVSGDDYDPGDVLLLVGSFQYVFTPTSLLLVDLQSIMTTRDRQSGEDVFKQGDQYSLSARFTKTHKIMRVTYGLSYSMQEKNQSLGAGGITTEDRNMNNNRYELFANLFYPISGVFSLNGLLGYKGVEENGYDSNHPLYDGGYSKIQFGGGCTYHMSKKTYFTFNLRLFGVQNKADGLEPEDAVYQGFNTDIGFVYNFSK